MDINKRDCKYRMELYESTMDHIPVSLHVSVVGYLSFSFLLKLENFCGLITLGGVPNLPTLDSDPDLMTLCTWDLTKHLCIHIFYTFQLVK